MRKTKIICTLGPSTDKDGVLRELVASGMNVARFNFSHGSYEEHKGRLDNLKAIRAELGKPVAALLDTKGPEIRLKEFKNGVEMLEAGQTFTLTTREVEGTKEICSITYKDLPQDVQAGGTIMLDDGLIKLRIEKVTDTDITCTVLNSGKIKTKKGVNVPGVHLSMPYLSQRDRDDIIFGVQQGFDFIAASFVRTAQDVYDIRNLLNEYDSNIRIIAKIENREGVDNIDSILAAADAVMVARGDLGVEIDFTELPGIQKSVIDRSFSFGKPIVTATQMLDSMMVNPRPTRAEISDVANAIYDGTSAIMLSGETAAGAYPVEALRDHVRHCRAHRKRGALPRQPPGGCPQRPDQRQRCNGPRRLPHRPGRKCHRHRHGVRVRQHRPPAEQVPPGPAHHRLRHERAGAAPAGHLLGHHPADDASGPQHR